MTEEIFVREVSPGWNEGGVPWPRLAAFKENFQGRRLSDRNAGDSESETFIDASEFAAQTLRLLQRAHSTRDRK